MEGATLFARRVPALHNQKLQPGTDSPARTTITQARKAANKGTSSRRTNLAVGLHERHFQRLALARASLFSQQAPSSDRP